ncbi:hypothetical protein MKW92_046507 [Papaver armeniacum]|nr:hypothetical protein MKW92_046507 [Papaver armeniacum]
MSSSFSIFVFLLFSAAFNIEDVTTQQRNSTISLNSTLYPNTNTFWLSSSGIFAFGFYKEHEGFAVGIWLTKTPEKTVVWTTNRTNPKVSSNVRLLFTSGGLILRYAQGKNITISRHEKLASSASMQDTCNFSFKSPTNSLLRGQRFLPGMVMHSSASEADHSKGRFLLIMQVYGYLVQYPALIRDLYNNIRLLGFGTRKRRREIILTFGIAKTLSESKVNEMMYYLKVDVDDKYDNCGPKGLCGSNGYYTLMDPKAYCLCLLGFCFVDPDQPTLECERENMSTLEKKDWTETEVNNYFVAISANRDEYREACLVDCNCEAAIFDDPLCRNQKLPLRFGRTTFNASSKTTFIKVANNELTVVATKELEKATNNFKEVLGRGSFGTVTKGKLSNASQTIIVVKRLEPKMVNEGEKEFLAEMNAIGRTHHSTFGVLPRGKVEIALSVARVIFYLHEECETQIIHRDIKPHIILMDHNNSPKITDFRLTKLLKQDQTKTFTVMGGTKGYITPEWYRNFPITVKEDVYSFGIILMKIICCRRALNMELCLYCGKLDKLVTREEEVDMRKFERMVIVALCCIQDEPSLRPSMKNVVLMLEGTINIPNPPNPDSSSSPVLSCPF